MRLSHLEKWERPGTLRMLPSSWRRTRPNSLQASACRWTAVRAAPFRSFVDDWVRSCGRGRVSLNGALFPTKRVARERHMTLRTIRHPGPASPERTAAIAGSAVPLQFTLEPGQAVDAAIAKGFASFGCTGGFVEFTGGRCEPFQFVMPAASPDALHAAWYSETFEPAGSVEIERACAIVGWRDGKLFIHCHGIWNSRDGRQMGHMLGPVTIVAEPIVVTGIGSRTAAFKALPDAETNFTLFEPML